MRENAIEKKALKEEKLVFLKGENQTISNIIVEDGDMKLFSMEPTYTTKTYVYSFAMTCYEVLTGNVPFDGFLRLAIHDKIMEGVWPKLPPHIDTRLSNLIPNVLAHRSSKATHIFGNL